MELREERWENQMSVEQGSDATNTSINSITGAKLLNRVNKTNTDEEFTRQETISAYPFPIRNYSSVISFSTSDNGGRYPFVQLYSRWFR